MSEQIGHVKNPLTVISRFAAIAEISGTVVLPFIAPENQQTFIWFLMLFPALLVIAFFLTLNFNHKKLYAPSDYKDEKNFMDYLGIATPDETEEKLKGELKEDLEPDSAADRSGLTTSGSGEPETQASPRVSAEEQDITPPLAEPTGPGAPIPTQHFDVHGFKDQINRETLEDLRHIEHKSIMKLKVMTQIPFKTNVKFDIPELSSPLFFDAVGVRSNVVHLAEVKYFKSLPVPPRRFYGVFDEAHAAIQLVRNTADQDAVLHLVIIVDAPLNEREVYRIKDNVSLAAKRWDINFRLYIASREDLLTKLMPFAG